LSAGNRDSQKTEAKFLDEIQAEVFRVFLLIPVFTPNSTLYSLQLCLEISISSNSRNLLRISAVKLLYTVKEKERKPDRNLDRKPYPFQMV
jgi:hypothetical protein